MEQFAEFPLTTFSTKKLKVASFTIFVENYLNISCKKKYMKRTLMSLLLQKIQRITKNLSQILQSKSNFSTR